MRSRSLAPLLALLLAGAFAAAALGGDLPKLPADRALPQTADSPGVVTFRHGSHIDATRPDCTPCHPKLFRILKREEPQPAITHAAMDKGLSCGACHNGQSAFGRDDCAACHASP